MAPRRTFDVEVSATTSADAATLFALVSDGGRWPEWGAPLVPRGSLERRGDPAPAGIGAVRKLGRKPLFLREETVGYEQDRRHAYVLRTPAPIADYRGEVRLVPLDGGGTDLVWRCSFAERVPFTGPPVRWALHQFLSTMTKRLIRHAEGAR